MNLGMYLFHLLFYSRYANTFVLAIWLLDSLSARKVKLNPIQVRYYNGGTWAIIQAFTSPLSIFYRFHSSVCLSDVWQEVYGDAERYHGEIGSEHNSMHRPVNANDRFRNYQHH